MPAGADSFSIMKGGEICSQKTDRAVFLENRKCDSTDTLVRTCLLLFWESTKIIQHSFNHDL